MLASPIPPVKQRPARRGRFLVSDRCRNAQFNFSAGVGSAPSLKCPTNEIGPLTHPMQAPMARNTSAFENVWINSLSVIPDVQAKVLVIVFDLYFNLSSLRMPKGIAQRLDGDPIDFVSHIV